MKYMQAISEGKIVTIRLSDSMWAKIAEMAAKPEPKSEPKPINPFFQVGDRVQPIGWEDSETGERPTATVISVSQHGVKVLFGRDVTRDGTNMPFSFVNEAIEKVD